MPVVDMLFSRFLNSLFQNFMEHVENQWKKTDHTEVQNLIREETLPLMEKIALRALILDLHRKKETGVLTGETPEEQYACYCEHWLTEKQNAEDIFKEYPELERLLSKQITQIYQFVVELQKHLEQDKTEIIKIFCDGASFEKIRTLKFTGDSHKEGRRTVRVELDNGTILYYKPHGLKNCLYYQAAYRYFCEKTGVTYKEIKYLSRETYGWEENLVRKPCETEQEVERFYFRMGIHLLLAYALGGTDLHGENIIAWGEYPMIIDMETYPGYLAQTEESSVKEKIEMMLSRSVNHTGLLPVPTWGSGKNTVLLGALNTGKIVTPFKMPVVKKANTSEMYIDYEPITLEMNENTVRLKEKSVNGNTYAGALANGFQLAYEVLLFDEIPKKLLKRFFEGKSRVVLRHTQQYVMYQLLSWHPDFMNTREDRRKLLSVIHKEGETETEKRIHDYEIQSLLENDIPYFEIEGKSCNLVMGGEKQIRDYFPCTPYEAWERHMDQLSRKDCRRQMDLIRLSLEMLGKEPWTEKRREERADGKAQKLPRGIRIKSQIDQIVDWIVDRAVLAEDSVGWMGLRFLENGYWKMATSGMYLYDGISGIAVFLAEYLKRFPNRAVQTIFQQIVRQMVQYTENLEKSSAEEMRPTGLFDGESSMVYAFLLLYQKTGDQVYLSYAKRHFALMGRFFAADENCDYLSGNAGGILAALLLHEMTEKDDSIYLETAVQLEKELWKKSIQMNPGVGWKLFHAERPLAGMAHGNSGFLMTYAKLYQKTGDSSYQNKMKSLLRYERSLYSEEKGNWLDLRRSEGELGTMNAWCHGAPGILLARLELEEQVGREIVAQDLKWASDALFHGTEDGKICLCHGLAGRLLIMRVYLKRHNNPEQMQIYQKKTDCLLTMLEQEQVLWESELRNPAFMNGISGVGYALLKLYEEEKSLSD